MFGYGYWSGLRVTVEHQRAVVTRSTRSGNVGHRWTSLRLQVCVSAQPSAVYPPGKDKIADKHSILFPSPNPTSQNKVIILLFIVFGRITPTFFTEFAEKFPRVYGFRDKKKLMWMIGIKTLSHWQDKSQTKRPNGRWFAWSSRSCNHYVRNNSQQRGFYWASFDQLGSVYTGCANKKTIP